MSKVVFSLQLSLLLFSLFLTVNSRIIKNNINARKLMWVLKIQKPNYCFCQETFLVLV